jgi:hypothetical protein
MPAIFFQAERFHGGLQSGFHEIIRFRFNAKAHRSKDPKADGQKDTDCESSGRIHVQKSPSLAPCTAISQLRRALQRFSGARIIWKKTFNIQ